MQKTPMFIGVFVSLVRGDSGVLVDSGTVEHIAIKSLQTWVVSVFWHSAVA
jgi:hypothetical protein